MKKNLSWSFKFEFEEGSLAFLLSVLGDLEFKRFEETYEKSIIHIKNNYLSVK